MRLYDGEPVFLTLTPHTSLSTTVCLTHSFRIKDLIALHAMMQVYAISTGRNKSGNS